MQSQQPLCRLKTSAPATVAPAFDQTCHSTTAALSTSPMGDVPGVENRNLTPGGSKAPTAIQSGLIQLDRRLNSDDTLFHRTTIVRSFQSYSNKHSLCLSGDDRYNSFNIAEGSQHSFQLCSVLSSSPETVLFNPVVDAQTTVPAFDIPLRPRAIRSLTTTFDVDPAIMTSVTGIPGSPPELTESRSSKSSSYGSQPSSPDELGSGMMHFEEIGLEDDTTNDAENVDQGRTRSNDKENNATSKKGPQRPSLSTLQTRPKPYLRSVENGVKSAGIGPIKRGFTSPAMVSTQSSESASRTRSSSPPSKKTAQRSASAVHRPGLSPSLTMPPRRGSWQPARKSIREIEAEYHDSDDDLPDDASLFNVPMSPFPSYPRSARSSNHGSPEREVSAQSPRPFPLAHARTAPDLVPRKMGSSHTLPRNRLTPRSSSSNLSRSIPSSPQTTFGRTGRAKSWNLAMADLSDEARVIAEKLEHHSEWSPLQDAIANHRSSAPGAIPLPPIQTGTIDFMPMSKEKEAILSRTRPSWLPPKDPQEEKRHLKEYQKMMKASLEAEKRKEEKSKQQRSTTDETRASLNRIWTYYVDPETDIDKIDQRVHDLCWRGIPSTVRGKVWQRRVGNSLGLTIESYHKAVQRAQDIKAKPVEEQTALEKNMIGWFADVERDAETALPELRLFQRLGPFWQDLINICEAYTAYRSDVGYNYGLQLIAAILLVQLSKPAEVFILLANCLNKPMPLAFQTGELEAVRRTYAKVISTLEIKFPRLHHYLFASQESGGLAFRGEELFEPMFQTLFANGLDIDRLCRVWDIWVFEGDRHLIRSAVALLGSLQSQIFDVQGDIHLKRRNIQEMLGWGPFNRSQNGYWNLQALGDDEAFVTEIDNASRLDHTGQ